MIIIIIIIHANTRWMQYQQTQDRLPLAQVVVP